jgi:hypothetical protein
VLYQDWWIGVLESNFNSGLDSPPLGVIEFECTISREDDRRSLIWQCGLARTIRRSCSRVASWMELCFLATKINDAPKSPQLSIIRKNRIPLLEFRWGGMVLATARNSMEKLRVLDIYGNFNQSTSSKNCRLSPYLVVGLFYNNERLSFYSSRIDASSHALFPSRIAKDLMIK